jgi:hypothetical protein
MLAQINSCKGIGTKRSVAILKDQRGSALVVALIMMVVLTLVGLASVFTSSYELSLSGNKRGSTDAFYAADSGVHVTVARIENFDLAGKYVADKYDPFSDQENPNPTHAAVTITHDTTQLGPPRGTRSSATNFEYEHFVVDSTGKDQLDLGPAKSTCTVQEKVVRLVPTSQGGY